MRKREMVLRFMLFWLALVGMILYLILYVPLAH